MIKPINIVIPMAGKGSRFSDAGYETPKPLIKVGGKTIIEHSIDSLGIAGQFIFITSRYDNEEHNLELKRVLDAAAPGHIQIEVDDRPQRGATDSALYAKQFINNDDALIVTNCDQLLEWDATKFMEFIDFVPQDGCVVTYQSTDLRNSFVKLEDGYVTEIVEKRPLSDIALIGLHYWDRGSLFVESGEHLLDTYEALGYKEAFVSATYQSLLDNNHKITAYMIEEGGFIPLGIPEDLDAYNSRSNNEDFSH